MAALAYAEDEHDEAPEALNDDTRPEVMKLEEIASSDINLAEHLTDTQRNALISTCIEGYERDCASREDWVKGFDKGMELVRLTPRDASNLMFDRAADVRFPLLAVACIQFNARSYPAIVNGPQIVRAEVEGDDPNGLKAERGERVAEHMSWQMLTDMPEWEPDTDKLLLHLPAAGMAFRSYTWLAREGRPKSEFISAKRFVINQDASDIKTAALFTIEFEKYPYQIMEKQRAGQWREVALNHDDERGQKLEKLLRCHVRFDLDDDGYPEPYIAVIHKVSNALLSLRPDFWPKDVKRDEQGRVLTVERRTLIQPYGFIPDPEGKFYSLGFGQLLLNHNEIIDALINQMLDAATLNNMGGGFIGQGVKMPGGDVVRRPGEWMNVNATGQDLRAAMVPHPQIPVSPASMPLLQLIIQSGKEVTSISDALTGAAPANQPATTTLSNVEQASQIISAISKRVLRSMSGEAGILYALNAEYLSDQAYYQWGGSQKDVARADYAEGDFAIKPVADPSMASAPQRMAQAQFLEQRAKGNSLYDPRKVEERILQLARIPAYGELMAPPQQPSPVDQLHLEAAATEVAAKHAEVQATAAKTRATDAKTMLDTAQAEAALIQNEVAKRALGEQDAGAQAGAAAAHGLAAFEAISAHPIDPGSLGGMGGPPGDAPSDGGAPPPGGLAGAGNQGGALAVGGADGGGSGVPPVAPSPGGNLPGAGGPPAQATNSPGGQ